MKPDTFTVAEAAKLVGIDPGRLRGWMQHRSFIAGTKGITGRYRFTIRDVRAISLMARLVDHGISPNVAADQAASVVDRIGDWSRAPLVAVFSRDPKVSPILVPEDVVPAADAIIVVSLGPLFAEIDARATA